MKRKIIKKSFIIMVLCCFLETVLCFMTVYAEGFDSPKSEDAEKRSGLYSYKEIYDGIMITNYFGDEKIVDIPEKIDGKEVRAIGEWCFGCNESIWTVIVPDTVHTIEHEAFSLCSLRQIDLPEGLTTIGRAAFADSDLTSIYIPASVEYMDEYAFAGCINLRSVCIEAKITILQFASFQGCSNLRDISLSDTIEWIEFAAFDGCKSLFHVKFPKRLGGVFEHIFWDSRKLDNETREALEKLIIKTDDENEESEDRIWINPYF